jgi:hypothetical protein
MSPVDFTRFAQLRVDTHEKHRRLAELPLRTFHAQTLG